MKSRLKKIDTTNNKSPENLLKAIYRIAFFSYEPAIAKYPFLKKYLKKEKDPKARWVILMTAAGVGNALLTKEAYPGKRDEILKSIESISGLAEIVNNFCDFMLGMYKENEKFYQIGFGAWIIRHIRDNKPLPEERDETLKEMDEINQTVGQLLNATIEDYETK